MAIPPFADPDGYRGRLRGYSGTATKNTTSNVQWAMAEDRYMQGGNIILKNHVFGDTFKFQVVDVDNILGYGAGTVLDEFITDWNVAEDRQGQDQIIYNYTAKVYAGLYLRIVYTSTGTENDVQVRVNLFLHKKT